MRLGINEPVYTVKQRTLSSIFCIRHQSAPARYGRIKRSVVRKREISVIEGTHATELLLV